MSDYCIVSPTISRKGIKPIAPRNGSALMRECKTEQYRFTIPENKTAAQKSWARDRSIIGACKPSDYAVYAAHHDVRHLVGIVRKCDGRIMWRRVTDNGLGSWHVLQGYTKRMPMKEMRRAFNVASYLNCYMVDIRQIVRVTKREDSNEVYAMGPHDRRPQEYIYEGKYPKKK